MQARAEAPAGGDPSSNTHAHSKQPVHAVASALGNSVMEVTGASPAGDLERALLSEDSGSLSSN